MNNVKYVPTIKNVYYKEYKPMKEAIEATITAVKEMFGGINPNMEQQLRNRALEILSNKNLVKETPKKAEVIGVDNNSIDRRGKSFPKAT